MQQCALVRRGPARCGLGQRPGIAIGIAHIVETGLLRFVRCLRPHRKYGQVAPAGTPDQGAHPIGAGEKNGLNAREIRLRAIGEMGGKKRRQHWVMAQRTQLGGDFLAVFQRTRD